MQVFALVFLLGCWSGIPVHDVEFRYLHESRVSDSCRDLERRVGMLPKYPDAEPCKELITDGCDEYFRCMFQAYYLSYTEVRDWIALTLQRCREGADRWTE